MTLIETWSNVNRLRRKPVEMIVLAGGLLLLSLVTPPIPCAFVILAVSFIVATVVAGIPYGVYLRVMAWPMSFIVTGSVAIAFSVGMDDAGRIGISVSHDGVIAAATVSLRSIAAVGAMTLLVMTTPAPYMFCALRRVGVPKTIVGLSEAVYRFIATLSDMMRSIMRAQSGRLGYKNIRLSYGSLTLALRVLLTRTLEKETRLEMGLAARCYQGVDADVNLIPPPAYKALAIILLLHTAIAVIGLMLSHS